MGTGRVGERSETGRAGERLRYKIRDCSWAQSQVSPQPFRPVGRWAKFREGYFAWAGAVRARGGSERSKRPRNAYQRLPVGDRVQQLRGRLLKSTSAQY